MNNIYSPGSGLSVSIVPKKQARVIVTNAKQPKANNNTSADSNFNGQDIRNKAAEMLKGTK